MKRLIKLILNIFPRTLLQRAAGWAVPLLGIFYLGRGRECPLCGARRRRFLPYGYVTPREDALCPRCLSLERHRLLWLYLERETSLGTDRPGLLHAAPEVALMRRLRRLYSDVPERYVTADLESPLADMHFDIQQMPLADGSFDVVICNHILEHVEDDRRALREIFRVMRGGGWGIILSPVDLSRAETFEDDTVTRSVRVCSGSMTIAVSMAVITPRVLRRRASRSRTATMLRNFPRPSVRYMRCRPTIYI